MSEKELENKVHESMNNYVDRDLEITGADIEALKIACRESLRAYIKFMAPETIFPDFYDEFIDILEQIDRWTLKKVIINMPPRSWKSRVVTQLFASWYLGRHTSKEVMVVSYSQGLTTTHSKATREILRDERYQFVFNKRLKDDAQWVEEWYTTDSGKYIAVGAEWSVIGKGYHLWIIDDLYNWSEEADSDKIREKRWEFYKDSFYNRRYPNDYRIIVIMTRWHEDDLVWRLLQQDPDGWRVMNVEAIIWEDDRPEEEWKSYFPPPEESDGTIDTDWNTSLCKPIKELIEERKLMWARKWWAIFRGNPKPDTGIYFTREGIKYYDKIEVFNSLYKLRRFTFLDPAISKKDSADRTAIVTIWVDAMDNVYILDVTAWRYLPDEVMNKLFDIYQKFTPEKIWIEVVQFQKMLALEIRKEMINRNIFFNLDEIHPMWEKESRIKSNLQTLYETNRIFHMKGMDLLEDELLVFPNWQHDDTIDALSGAVAMIWLGWRAWWSKKVSKSSFGIKSNGLWNLWSILPANTRIKL